MVVLRRLGRLQPSEPGISDVFCFPMWMSYDFSVAVGASPEQPKTTIKPKEATGNGINPE